MFDYGILVAAVFVAWLFVQIETSISWAIQVGWFAAVAGFSALIGDALGFGLVGPVESAE